MRSARKPFTAIVISLLMFTMVANLTACGTLLHPERRGQRGGSIDAGVAILDAVGLLFFVIPGLIAFAVDFSNGTIYLPHRRASNDDAGHQYSALHVNGKLDIATVEEIVSARTGTAVDLHQSNVQVVRLETAEGLDVQFALYEADTRVAMAH